VRPWQHVLDALHGYLRLGERLLSERGAAFAKAWNFGPRATMGVTAGEIAQTVARLWGRGARVEHAAGRDDVREAGLLHLDSSQAAEELGWAPRWSLEQALEQTVLWHRAWLDGTDMAAVSLGQIAAHEQAGTA
jgi:CDP-glucose 4,6-dehydratase